MLELLLKNIPSIQDLVNKQRYRISTKLLCVDVRSFSVLDSGYTDYENIFLNATGVFCTKGRTWALCSNGSGFKIHTTSRLYLINDFVTQMLIDNKDKFLPDSSW